MSFQKQRRFLLGFVNTTFLMKAIQSNVETLVALFLLFSLFQPSLYHCTFSLDYWRYATTESKMCLLLPTAIFKVPLKTPEVRQNELKLRCANSFTHWCTEHKRNTSFHSRMTNNTFTMTHTHNVIEWHTTVIVQFFISVFLLTHMLYQQIERRQS